MCHLGCWGDAASEISKPNAVPEHGLVEQIKGGGPPTRSVDPQVPALPTT